MVLTYCAKSFGCAWTWVLPLLTSMFFYRNHVSPLSIKIIWPQIEGGTTRLKPLWLWKCTVTVRPSEVRNNAKIVEALLHAFYNRKSIARTKNKDYPLWQQIYHSSPLDKPPILFLETAESELISGTRNRSNIAQNDAARLAWQYISRRLNAAPAVILCYY